MKDGHRLLYSDHIWCRPCDIPYVRFMSFGLADSVQVEEP